ncbi:hypothetical protein ATANTOWER_019567, partial [Ataeniobius toweri]|nr:hypothetical protein [Ataeniobius toweri]
MPNQKGEKRGLETSKTKLTSEKANEASTTLCNMLYDTCHNYAATTIALALNDDEMDKCPPLPVTPLKSPASKKVMYKRGNLDPSTTNVIISSLSTMLNTRSDTLESKVRENLMVKENA